MAVVQGDNEAWLPEVVGESPGLAEVWRFVKLAAPSQASVLIRGETGVGKELVARALHAYSQRAEKPFVAVSCAALPETLLESELFGHEKGAFTGAVARRQGRFELADGGTLFLDEVGELPPTMQVKLLRVLEEHSFERLGGNDTISVNVRIVAATNRGLDDEIRRGRFRADLFYRLNVLSVHVPPLRARRSDIPALWEHLVARSADQDKRPHPATDPQVLRVLLAHEWMGNIRELDNVARHAVTVTSGPMITLAELPDYLRSRVPDASEAELRIPGMSLREIERIVIMRTLDVAGSLKEAAQMLGVSLRKLHYRIKEYRSEGFLADELPAEGLAQQKRVLLAEDDDEVRWALADFLRDEGYHVVAVPSGAALLEHLGAAFLLEQRDQPPDVIVTDVRMPGVGGMRLLEGVRARGWQVPVIIISAFGDPETRQQAFRLGASAFLDKPLDISKLRRTLHQFSGVGGNAGPEVS